LSLPRTLEPEPNDLRAEALAYEQMDHAAVNQRFVDDLVRQGDVGPRIIDLGCGPALIPIEICHRNDQWVAMGIDASLEMLEIAKREIDFAGMLDRISLEHATIAQLNTFSEQMADTVVSNSLLHHLESPALGLEMALHLTRDGGRIFMRDLARPQTEQEVEALVRQHAADESPQGQQMLRQSLHAALTLDETRDICSALGIAASKVQMTSDRHWTIDTPVTHATPAKN